MRNGSLVSSDLRELYTDYRDSWRVALGSSESLFRRGPDFWDPNFPSSRITLSDFDAAAVDRARATCRAAGVTTSQVVDDCAFDIVVTGDNGWAAEAVKVDPATPTVIVDTGSRLYLAVGESRPFAAAISGLTNRAVTWASSGGSVLVNGERQHRRIRLRRRQVHIPSRPGPSRTAASSPPQQSWLALAVLVHSLVSSAGGPAMGTRVISRPVITAHRKTARRS